MAALASVEISLTDDQHRNLARNTHALMTTLVVLQIWLMHTSDFTI